MAERFTVTAIGTVASPRTEPLDNDWGDIVSTITLDADQFTPDVIAGTPVLDIKPYVIEFAPRSTVSQPTWIGELMADYWQQGDQ